MAGAPVRMVVMVTLAASVLVAVAVRDLRPSRAWLAGLTLLWFVEILPAPLPQREPAVPRHIEALRDLPDGAVMDLRYSHTRALYYQTVHGKPMAFGYVSRVPESVSRRAQEIRRLWREGNVHDLRRAYGIRYILRQISERRVEDTVTRYRDAEVEILELIP